MKKVEEGTKIADSTAKSLREIVQSVEKVSDLILQIDDASAQQASSLDQVTQGVEQISSVVQTNLAIAEESAATSEDLARHANMLDSMVSNFKLKTEGF